MELNIPKQPLKITKQKDKMYVWDVWRQKYVAFTPEEWVRQQLLHYLVNDKAYPTGLISVEKEIRYNNLKKRYDAVIFNNTLKPFLAIECKAPQVQISQATFQQIATYNMALQVKYLLVSNGMQHYFCTQNADKNFEILHVIPHFSSLYQMDL